MGEGIRIGGGGKSEGLNVWARHYYTPEETVTGLRFTATQPAVSYDNLIWNISDCNYDISRISNFIDFYDGFRLSDGRTITKLTGDKKIMCGNMMSTTTVNGNLIIWDYITTTFSEKVYTATSSGAKTLNAVVGEIKDYVVDDDPNAYPNGAAHTDGYYYELLGQITSANVMSLSDNALETVQQDYRDTIETEVSNANA